jgi:hypothetical protein
MKKVFKILLVSIVFTFSLLFYDVREVNAATGYFSISASSSVTVGDTFSVTIKATGSKIFYWQFYVSYSTSKLKLVSGSTTIQGEADDIVSGVSTITRTLKFKALSTGSTTISVTRGDADMNIDTSSASISYSTVKKTININPVVPKSTNNNLSALAIDNTTLSPVFDSNVTSYTAEFEANTTEVNVNATATDAKATISGAGKVAVVEGSNTINVVVTAENGAQKTYIIAATVKELSPIEVKVGNKTFNVIRKKGIYEIPKNFEETSIKIGEENVLAYTNKKIACTILGLKDDKGNAGIYIYDANNNTYTPYQNITLSGINLYLKAPRDKADIPVGYKDSSFEINKISYDAWRYNDSKFYLIYGANTETGEESFYLYDQDKATIQRFYRDQVDDLERNLQQKQLILIIVSGVATLFAITSLLLLIKTLKKREKRKVKPSIDEYMEITSDIEEQLKKGKRKK